MYCKNCGSKILNGAEFCSDCGVLVGNGDYFCAECGAEVGEARNFCPKCGSSLSEEVVLIKSDKKPIPEKKIINEVDEKYSLGEILSVVGGVGILLLILIFTVIVGIKKA